MKFVILPLVAILFGVLRVNSLDCYQCVSPSLDDCLSQATQQTCYGLTKCGTIGIKYQSGDISSEAFVKGCMTDDICNGELPDACSEEGYECSASCCSSDLCNGGEDGGEEGSTGETLSCKQCFSMTSMGECIENEVDKQCENGEDHCGVMSAHKEDTSMFRKDCIPGKYCDTLCKDGYNEEGGFYCELHCCEGDYCNGNDSIIS